MLGYLPRIAMKSPPRKTKRKSSSSTPVRSSAMPKRNPSKPFLRPRITKKPVAAGCWWSPAVCPNAMSGSGGRAAGSRSVHRHRRRAAHDELIEAWSAASRPAVRRGLPEYLYDHTTTGEILALLFHLRQDRRRLQTTSAPTASFRNCAVPCARAASTSVEAEVRRLVADGVQEINLIAQDLTAFGNDRHDGARLEDLLQGWSRSTDLQWIRLLYAYPDGISEDLVELVATEEKICSYLDMPCSTSMTAFSALMNRRVDEAGIRSLVGRCAAEHPGNYPAHLLHRRLSRRDGRAVRPPARLRRMKDISIGSACSVIPAKKAPPPRSLPDQVPERVKKAREQKLMKAQQRVSFRRNRALVGQHGAGAGGRLQRRNGTAVERAQLSARRPMSTARSTLPPARRPSAASWPCASPTPPNMISLGRFWVPTGSRRSGLKGRGNRKCRARFLPNGIDSINKRKHLLEQSGRRVR
jgi:hypothetical protein